MKKRSELLQPLETSTTDAKIRRTARRDQQLMKQRPRQQIGPRMSLKILARSTFAGRFFKKCVRSLNNVL